MTPGNPHADFLRPFSLQVFPPWLSASQIQAASVAQTLFFTLSETTLLQLPLLCATIWKKARANVNSPNVYPSLKDLTTRCFCPILKISCFLYFNQFYSYLLWEISLISIIHHGQDRNSTGIGILFKFPKHSKMYSRLRTLI